MTPKWPKSAVLWGKTEDRYFWGPESHFWDFRTSSENRGSFECCFGCFEWGSSSRIHSTFSSSHGDWPPYGHSLWQRATKGASSLVPRSGAPLDSPYSSAPELKNRNSQGGSLLFHLLYSFLVTKVTGILPIWELNRRWALKTLN